MVGKKQKAPLCAICSRKVGHWKTLKGCVTWDGGDLKGQYMHSRCFIDSGECAREVERALLPMTKVLEEIGKK